MLLLCFIHKTPESQGACSGSHSSDHRAMTSVWPPLTPRHYLKEDRIPACQCILSFNKGLLSSYQVPGQETHLWTKQTKLRISWRLHARAQRQRMNKCNTLQPVRGLTHILLFATPWTAARQASLSITNSRGLLRLMYIQSVTPSNHFILCHPLSSCFQSFPASGSLPTSQFYSSGGQSIGVSASASVFSMNIQDWFPLGWTAIWHLVFLWGEVKWSCSVTSDSLRPHEQ